MKLLFGLLEPTEGEILVGGIKLTKLGLSNYRRLLGTVMPDDSLFAGSIADNISFFVPSPSQQQTQAGALLAAVHDEITAMPMGIQHLDRRSWQRLVWRPEARYFVGTRIV
ncbi:MULTISPECIES: hypothetical protein [unclassified Undibacterium]|uniref:hypothetical protein n=1 Tax=unclassified Undibacterium TaxID=2630295 RepID=UPI002B22A00B|nr:MULTISPECIES: hypothetical protein [unclassified Undibacterium]